MANWNSKAYCTIHIFNKVYAVTLRDIYFFVYFLYIDLFPLLRFEQLKYVRVYVMFLVVELLEGFFRLGYLPERHSPFI